MLYILDPGMQDRRDAGLRDTGSVAEPEPPGAATFRAAPEPIFFLGGAGRRSRLFLGGSGSGCIF